MLSSIVYCSRDVSMRTWHCYSLSVKCITVAALQSIVIWGIFTNFTYNEYI